MRPSPRAAAGKSSSETTVPQVPAAFDFGFENVDFSVTLVKQQALLILFQKKKNKIRWDFFFPITDTD